MESNKKCKSNLIYYIHKLSHNLYKWHIPILPFLLKQFMRFVFCAVLPPSVITGKDVTFGYNGLGIVLQRRVVIGSNVLISQNVTIGGRGSYGVPIIGDNVYIGAGAKILGDIKIGNGAKIGANAVVIKDVPANSTAVGVPAKILRKKI